jgi:hypothetical protein
MTYLECRIRLQGRLCPEWSEWLDGLAIRYEGNDTVLAGPLPDQSALYGLLIRLRDLGLVLLSLETGSRAPAE